MDVEMLNVVNQQNLVFYHQLVVRVAVFHMDIIKRVNMHHNVYQEQFYDMMLQVLIVEEVMKLEHVHKMNVVFQLVQEKHV